MLTIFKLSRLLTVTTVMIVKDIIHQIKMMVVIKHALVKMKKKSNMIDRGISSGAPVIHQ